VKIITFFSTLVFSGSLLAQIAEFNPMKELQTIPNAARITVSVEKTGLFNFTRRVAVFIDGNRVADGDSDNPATIEIEPGREFVLEACTVSRIGDVLTACVFGGVMRPADNTWYKLNLKFNQGLNAIAFVGKQSF